MLALPTDGDSAYPGRVSLDPGNLIMFYYSQHAYKSGVFAIEPRTYPHLDRWASVAGAGLALARNCGPSDIFLAEIDVAAENSPRTSF